MQLITQQMHLEYLTLPLASTYPGQVTGVGLQSIGTSTATKAESQLMVQQHMNISPTVEPSVVQLSQDEFASCLCLQVWLAHGCPVLEQLSVPS